jgi:hypothetical protein
MESGITEKNKMSKLADSRTELFSLFWWDVQGNQHTELKHVALSDLKSPWLRLTQGPAARLGMVQRVMITDGFDCVAQLWDHPLCELEPSSR